MPYSRPGHKKIETDAGRLFDEPQTVSEEMSAKVTTTVRANALVGLH